MSKSRYADTQLVDGKSYRSWRMPKVAGGLRAVDLLAGVKTNEYTIQAGDRADHIAARFLGDDEYWWLICLVNGINYPFASGGWTPGRTIKVPVFAKDVLDKLLR